MTIVPAAAFEIPALAGLFTASFSDYYVPMRMDEAALREHVALNGIDLASSRVAIEDGPIAFVLIGRRDVDGWVGGMGTLPAFRRRGVGRRTLLAGIESVSQLGCRRLWLEVIAENRGAMQLYEDVGFVHERELTVWSLPPSGKRAGRTAAVEVDVAHAWIVANRTGREPWQRADEALAALRSVGATTQALAVRNGAEEICGALIYRDRGDAVTVLQIAAADERAAAELLLAAGGDGREVRLSNLATDHVATAAFGSLGARSVVKQYEMVLQLPTVAPPVASEDL